MAMDLYISHIFPQSKKDDAEELLHWYKKKAMHGSNLIGHASPKMDLHGFTTRYLNGINQEHVFLIFLQIFYCIGFSDFLRMIFLRYQG